MTGFHTALCAALAIAAISFAYPTPAAAAEYPWCVQYSDMDGGGGKNCGFVSYEQCMETARGAGGFCERNLFYPGNDTSRQQRPRKRVPKN